MIMYPAARSGWRRVVDSRTWVLGVNDLVNTDHLPNGNNEVIIPPSGELWLIKEFSYWYETTDSLVFAGGAGFCRVATEAQSPIFGIAAVAPPLPQFWISSSNANVRQADFYVLSGAIQNVPAAQYEQRQFTAAVDVGSVSGTLHWAYRYHVMATGL